MENEVFHWCAVSDPECLCNKCKHDTPLTCCLRFGEECPVEKCEYFEPEDEQEETK